MIKKESFLTVWQLLRRASIKMNKLWESSFTLPVNQKILTSILEVQNFFSNATYLTLLCK